ncbi:hypothetical protein U1Q18_006954 [Sarracenia purpurea var. burkii]
MFLDYDGTLSPIVKDSDPAFMTHEEAVRDVAKYFPRASHWEVQSQGTLQSIRKSPDMSEVHHTASPAILSNCSVEENGFEIVKVDSDAFSLTEGSTVESGCKLQPASIVECHDRNVELSQTLDFQTKVVVFKKKRKQNRKRVTNGDNCTQSSIHKPKIGEVEKKTPICLFSRWRSCFTSIPHGFGY